MIAAASDRFPAALQSALEARFPEQNGIFGRTGGAGYWSNIGADEQRTLLAALDGQSVVEVVRERLPSLQGFVLGDRRAAGLELLNIQPDHVGIDFGCMWGNLLIAAARRCRAMVGVDRTREHLHFLQHRLPSEGADNVALVNADLREELGLSELFDFAIVNGVLEWLPCDDDVTVGAPRSRRGWRLARPRRDPRLVQLTFLKEVRRSLKPGGALYLAIENRFDYQHFLWKRDPHADLWFTAQAPRAVANLIANAAGGRPYVTYLYSPLQLEALLAEAGFSRVDKYVAFPNYRHPVLILPLDRRSAARFRPVYPQRPSRNPAQRAFRAGRAALDVVVYRWLARLDLAPALVFLGRR